MEYQELMDLLAKLDQSTVAYLEYVKGDEKVILAKKVPFNQPMNTASADNRGLNSENDSQTVEELPNDFFPHEGSTTQAQGPIFKPQMTDDATSEVVKSPIVGVVYLQPQPEAETFVTIGEEVKKGQTICLIEAMKLMNEIVAPVDGVISEILVENDRVVEFDQPLFKITAK